MSPSIPSLAHVIDGAARVELRCLAAGTADSGLLTQEEAQTRATSSGRILERMWEFLTCSV